MLSTGADWMVHVIHHISKGSPGDKGKWGDECVLLIL